MVLNWVAVKATFFIMMQVIKILVYVGYSTSFLLSGDIIGKKRGGKKMVF